jgi:WD repeat-containing protein 42A
LYRVTAARDGLVKVFDVGAEVTVSDSTSPRSRGSPIRSGWKQRTIRCHSDSVKRITTELSPDVFLTVSEVSVPVPVFVIAWAEHTKRTAP